MSPAQTANPVIEQQVAPSTTSTNTKSDPVTQQCVDKASVRKFIKTLNREAIAKKQSSGELKVIIEEELIKRFARPKGDDWKNLSDEDKKKWINMTPQFIKTTMGQIAKANKKEDIDAAAKEIETSSLNSVKFHLGDEIFDVFEAWMTQNMDKLSTLQPVTLPASIDVVDPEFDVVETKDMTDEQKKEIAKRREKHPCHHIHLRKSFFKKNQINRGQRKEIFNEEIHNLERFFRYVIYQARQMTNIHGRVTIKADDVKFVLDTLSGICFQKERDRPEIPKKQKAEKMQVETTTTSSTDNKPKKETKKRARKTEEASSTESAPATKKPRVSKKKGNTTTTEDKPAPAPKKPRVNKKKAAETTA